MRGFHVPQRRGRGGVVSGFTLVELLVVIAIIGTLVGLLLPAVQVARETARQSSCSNNLKQMALAVANFHDAKSRFPMSHVEPDFSGRWNVTFSGTAGIALYGGIPTILPFLEEQKNYTDLVAGMVPGTSDPTGRAYNRNQSAANSAVISALICPSDSLPLRRTAWGGMLNYRMNGGDIWWYHLEVDPLQRGPFRKGDPGNLGVVRLTRSKDVTDGLSKTVLLGEAVTGSGDASLDRGVVHKPSSTITKPSQCMSYGNTGTLTISGTDTGGDVVGTYWASDRTGSTIFFTVQPPNTIRCSLSNPDNAQRARIPASSFHQGGAFVAMCDGAVRFVTNTIDTNNLDQTMASSTAGASKFGVWGSLGSIAGGESNSID